MSITPPALCATSPFSDRGGAANALLAESNKKICKCLLPLRHCVPPPLSSTGEERLTPSLPSQIN